MSDFYSDNFLASQSVLNEFITNKSNYDHFALILSKLMGCIRNNGRIYTCGNGGSMSDAMHFAEELTGRFLKNRNPIGAMAISDPGHLSCVANDFGYEEVFSRFLSAWGNPGDIVLAISTSGNSTNILNAIKVANEKKMTSLALLGKGGGKAAGIAHHSLIINSDRADRVQEMHIKLIHNLIEGIEREFFPENY